MTQLAVRKPVASGGGYNEGLGRSLCLSERHLHILLERNPHPMRKEDHDGRLATVIGVGGSNSNRCKQSSVPVHPPLLAFVGLALAWLPKSSAMMPQLAP